MTMTYDDPFAEAEVWAEPLPAPTLPPATERQVAFITKLKAERDTSQHILAQPTTRAQASDLIDLLLTLPKRAPADDPNKAPEGMHILDGVIYKVQVAHHGSGLPYAKRLVNGLPGEPGHFNYDPGSIKKLSTATLMTLEEAKAFGQLYGICCRCAAILTDETSIQNGIGPVCATKGWG